MVVNEADGHNAQFDGHQDQCMPEAQLLNSHWVLLHRRGCCSLLLDQGIPVPVPLKLFTLSLKVHRQIIKKILILKVVGKNHVFCYVLFTLVLKKSCKLIVKLALYKVGLSDQLG